MRVIRCQAILFLTTAVVLVTIGNKGANGKEEKKDDAPCKELLVGAVKRAMKEVSKCTKQLNLTTKEERKEKAACVMKCVAINIQLLNPIGELDEKLVLNFVDENVPLKYHDHAYEVMADCMHHAGSLDPHEPTCKTYDPIFKCVTDSATKFAKMCNDEDKKKTR